MYIYRLSHGVKKKIMKRPSDILEAGKRQGV